MKTPFSLRLALFILLPSAFIIAQGPLTPPGAPAPTMKTLDQVEARRPISTAPIIITQPGSYYLTGNLAIGTGGGTAITINVSDVTVDLNGFTISSSASPAFGNGVTVSSVNNVVIKNGAIRGTTTFSSGTFTSGGFVDGIASSSFARNVRIADIQVRGVAGDGIDLQLTTVPSFHVNGCSITVCGGLGIRATNVRDSSADAAGSNAISADIVVNCTGETVGSGGSDTGILATSILENSKAVAVAGPGANTQRASNSSGKSTDGPGLLASNATNCRGESTSSIGLSSNSATNCTGISSSGTGLAATNATNCSGTSSSGTGLSANNATNCFGTSGTGPAGIDANPGTASYCRGSRASGIAINAGIAIGCTVATGTVASANKFLGTP
jgi:hypothetical protein